MNFENGQEASLLERQVLAMQGGTDRINKSRAAANIANATQE